MFFNACILGIFFLSLRLCGLDPRAVFFREKRLGETSISNSGELMTIIEYRDAKDIDVKFANGGVKQHVLYQNFKAGLVRNPLSKR